MMDANPLFIDTNILVYANVAEAPLHQQAISALNTAYQSKRQLWISRQVIREFIAVRTRQQTFSQNSAPDVIAQRINYLEKQFQVADDTATVTKQLISLLKNVPMGGKQIHDANIVATMLAYNIPCLLTNNSKDFDRFSHLIKIEEIKSS